MDFEFDDMLDDDSDLEADENFDDMMNDDDIIDE